MCLYGLKDTGCFGGTGPQGGSLVLVSVFLHVKISVKVVRLYLGMVTSFGARLCWGGNVTFPGI